jgi:hypothetical protein
MKWKANNVQIGLRAFLTAFSFSSGFLRYFTQTMFGFRCFYLGLPRPQDALTSSNNSYLILVTWSPPPKYYPGRTLYDFDDRMSTTFVLTFLSPSPSPLPSSSFPLSPPLTMATLGQSLPSSPLRRAGWKKKNITKFHWNIGFLKVVVMDDCVAYGDFFTSRPGFNPGLEQISC